MSLTREAVGSMFGLSDEIPCGESRIGFFVGDYDQFSGACEEIDCNIA